GHHLLAVATPPGEEHRPGVGLELVRTRLPALLANALGHLGGEVRRRDRSLRGVEATVVDVEPAFLDVVAEILEPLRDPLERVVEADRPFGILPAAVDVERGAEAVGDDPGCGSGPGCGG